MRGHLLVDVPLVAGAVALWPTLGPVALAGAAGLSATIHTWAVIDPRSSLYMPVCWHLRRDAPGCALTFDDGPNPAVTPQLLDALDQQSQRATFFVIGSHVRRYPELVRRMRAAGHAVGLHSDTHSRWFNCWGPRRLTADLTACGAAIAEATGEPPPLLFRPPVGLKNPMVGFVCSQMGLHTVTWTARGRDTGRSNPADVVRRLLPAVRPGGILLLHDGHEPGRPGPRTTCLTALSDLCERMRASGLTSHALEIQAGRVQLAPLTPATPMPPALAAGT